MPAIHEAMIHVMRSIGAIEKSKRNNFHGYNFRGIDDVYKEMHRVMGEAGIFCTSKIVESVFEQSERKGKIECTARIVIAYQFWASDGSMCETEVAAMGADTGDKAYNKALAAAHKYALLQAFMVPCEGMDDQDGEGFQYSPKGDGGQPSGTKMAPPPAAPLPPSTTEDYDPDNPQHKKALGAVFKKIGVVEKEQMKKISEMVKGVQISQLGDTVEGMLRRVPNGF